MSVLADFKYNLILLHEIWTSISPEGLKSHLHYFKTRYKQGTHVKWIEEYY